MISNQAVVTLTRVELHVARITQGRHVAVVALPSRPRFGVVSAGLQGPVGTVAENVLEKAEQAELAAQSAEGLAAQTASDLSDVIDRLNGVFAYHAAAITAQEG